MLFDVNPFRYCGEYFDTETGSIYLRARYYKPSTGRFDSEDPIRDGLNWYTYANNNPIMFIDPFGLDAIVLLNPDSGGSYSEQLKKTINFGHMGIIVGAEDGSWWYFSCGNDYVKFVSVDEADVADLKTFNSKNYYAYEYVESVYIRGDFSESFEFFQSYEWKNRTDQNIGAYDKFTNNCSVVVMNGLELGNFYGGITMDEYMNSWTNELGGHSLFRP